MRLFIVPIILASAAALQADILHLRDGSRHYGELISQNKGEIVFRVELGDGSATVLRCFTAEQVVRVERTDRHPMRPVPRDDQAALDGRDEDYEQMLREGFELIDDDDPRAALRALQRAVLRAPEDVLPQLDRQCREARGTSLAELLARVRVHVAGLAQDGRSFVLRYATPYERAALSDVLARRQKDRLERRYLGRTVAEWAGDPSQYTELDAHARELVADASRAAALIRARLRFDERLKQQRKERVRLLRLRRDLTRLAAKVLALPGYTAPRDDAMAGPAQRVADELAEQMHATSQPVQAQSGAPVSTEAARVEDRSGGSGPRDPNLPEDP